MNKIEFNEISFVYIITAGDYTNQFFEDIRQSIVNHNIINREYEKQFTWNKPHLHFELIVTDKKKHVGAVVYPYEYFDSPKLLWLIDIDNPMNDSFLKELTIHQIYPALRVLS